LGLGDSSQSQPLIIGPRDRYHPIARCSFSFNQVFTLAVLLPFMSIA
jgi:hypothetical protein